MNEHDDPVMAVAIAEWAHTPHWPDGAIAEKCPMGEWLMDEVGLIMGLKFEVTMTAEQVQRAFPRG